MAARDVYFKDGGYIKNFDPVKFLTILGKIVYGRDAVITVMKKSDLKWTKDEEAAWASYRGEDETE